MKLARFVAPACCVLCCALLPLVAVAQPEPLSEAYQVRVPFFKGTFEQLKAEAARTRKPYILQFGVEECLGSRRLYSETFNNDTLAAYIKDHYLIYEVDGSGIMDNGWNLSQEFGVLQFPAMMIFGPYGRPYFRANGFIGGAMYLTYIDNASQVMKRYEEDFYQPMAGEFLNEIAYIGVKCHPSPSKYYEHLEEKDIRLISQRGEVLYGRNVLHHEDDALTLIVSDTVWGIPPPVPDGATDYVKYNDYITLKSDGRETKLYSYTEPPQESFAAMMNRLTRDEAAPGVPATGGGAPGGAGNVAAARTRGDEAAGPRGTASAGATRGVANAYTKVYPELPGMAEVGLEGVHAHAPFAGVYGEYSSMATLKVAWRSLPIQYQNQPRFLYAVEHSGVKTFYLAVGAYESALAVRKNLPGLKPVNLKAL